ncbi:MAG: helix-hairpin-helix domain-containing protein [Myxococcota bacterium]|nr:helix-hairpin-helix domain-containing protein [Myxococcota bacterium]
MIDLKQLEGLDLADLMAGAEQEEQSELSAVSRAVAAQFIQDLRGVFAEILRGREHLVLPQLEELLRSLTRLAKASDDTPQIALLQELEEATATYRERQARGSGRASFLDCVRSWLPRYAEMLGASLGGDLTKMVDYEDKDLPLFQELEDIRGIGPARLRRLFAAGLTHGHHFEGADPDDVASVTGLPRALAAAVCERAEVYRASKHTRALASLKHAHTALTEVLQSRDLPDFIRAETQARLDRLDQLHAELQRSFEAS